MRYLGLDLGTKTLGLSMSDQTNTIASFFDIIRFENEDYESLLLPLKKIIADYNIKSLVLGYPKNMNNSIGPRAQITLEFKELLEKELAIEVNLQDERRTTIEATNYMLESNASRKKRKEKIDGVAATIILQTYLDKMKGR